MEELAQLSVRDVEQVIAESVPPVVLPLVQDPQLKPIQLPLLPPLPFPVPVAGQEVANLLRTVVRLLQDSSREQERIQKDHVKYMARITHALEKMVDSGDNPATSGRTTGHDNRSSAGRHQSSHHKARH